MLGFCLVEWVLDHNWKMVGLTQDSRATVKQEGTSYLVCWCFLAHRVRAQAGTLVMVLHQQLACPSDDTEAREQSGNFQFSPALFFYVVHSKNAHVVSSAIGSYLLVLA